jgi:hypothetical protein
MVTCCALIVMTRKSAVASSPPFGRSLQSDVVKGDANASKRKERPHGGGKFKCEPHSAPRFTPGRSRHLSVPDLSQGLLDWSWARKRLTDSHNYVIVTVRPDGRPHAMGMHGLWFEDAYHFGTAEASRKAENLARNPHCIVINEKLDGIVIVEGIAQQVCADEMPKGLSEASEAKYGWPMGGRKGGLVFRVLPHVVFAFPEEQIATAVTRWTFE